jgi:hypothetical protein
MEIKDNLFRLLGEKTKWEVERRWEFGKREEWPVGNEIGLIVKRLGKCEYQI